jgi:hypothetical protein
MFRPTLEPTQPPLQQVRRIIFPGVKRPKLEADRHLRGRGLVLYLYTANHLLAALFPEREPLVHRGYEAGSASQLGLMWWLIGKHPCHCREPILVFQPLANPYINWKNHAPFLKQSEHWRCWSLVLKMEVVCSSETLVSTFKSTWRYNQEDQHRHLHCRENLKSHTIRTLL